jgi:uncharacterized protein (DUF302 family)
MVTKQSPGTVEETVSRLRDLIASKGLKLFVVIDHSGEADAHGLALRDTEPPPRSSMTAYASGGAREKPSR